MKALFVDKEIEKLVFVFEHDNEIVDHLYNLGAEQSAENKNRWFLPLDRAKEAIELGNKYGFKISNDVISVFLTPPADYRIDLFGRDSLKFIFPEDPHIIAAVAKIPGARYNEESKFWVVPILKEEDVEQFVYEMKSKYNIFFRISDQAKRFLANPDLFDEKESKTLPRYRLEMLGKDHVRFVFPENPYIVTFITKIPEARYNKEKKFWFAPISHKEELKHFVSQIKSKFHIIFYIPDDVKKRLDYPMLSEPVVNAEKALHPKFYIDLFEKDYLKLSIPEGAELVAEIKKIPGVWFSKEHKCWIAHILHRAKIKEFIANTELTHGVSFGMSKQVKDILDKPIEEKRIDLSIKPHKK